jgi:hypothetical protein
VQDASLGQNQLERIVSKFCPCSHQFRQPSLWSQISLGSIHVDVTRLEKFFSKKSNVVVKKVTKKEKESESKHEEPTIVRLKDQKSSQNLEIMLRKLPVIDRLRDCIFNLDSSTLTLDMIELMFQNVLGSRACF